MEAGSAAPVRDAFEAVAAKADSLDTIFNSAGTLPDLFEARRRVKDGALFITYAGEAYPW